MPNLISNKRILDLSRIIVGPYASNVLAGFGCQVIKIESPQGDPTRLWGPPWHNDTSTYFESVNCNKKSIRLNLKHERCRQILYKLVQKSDVVLQNFIPGTTQKLEIDYQTLSKYNQKLIYCSISGFGDITSKASYPVFDNIIQAQSGFMHLTGHQSTQPFKLGFAITDVLTALFASNSILAGLLYRQQHNKGIHLKTSLYQCAIASLINQSSNHLNGNINPNRLGNHHPNIIPYGLYKTKDAAVVICVGTVKQYEGLMRCIGVDINQKGLEEFKTNQLRVKNRMKFDQFLNAHLSRFTSKQILKLMDQNKVPCGQVNDLQQVFKSTLVQQLKMVQQVGNTKTIRNPIRASLRQQSKSSSNLSKLSNQSKQSKQSKQSQPSSSSSQQQYQSSSSTLSNIKSYPPPKLGQHTQQLLKQILGMSKQQIEQIQKLNSNQVI